jgi:hypothetical protein
LLDRETSRAASPTTSARALGGMTPAPWAAAPPGEALGAPVFASRSEGFHFGAWLAPTYAPHLELRRSLGAPVALRRRGVDA